jgi:hypothetical protein
VTSIGYVSDRWTCPSEPNLNGLQDGEGTGGGVTKPAPLLRINHSGTFKNVIVKNTPARAVAVGGKSITVDTVTVDNSQLSFVSSSSWSRF